MWTRTTAKSSNIVRGDDDDDDDDATDGVRLHQRSGRGGIGTLHSNIDQPGGSFLLLFRSLKERVVLKGPVGVFVAVRAESR